jgi:hypothetical protein
MTLDSDIEYFRERLCSSLGITNDDLLKAKDLNSEDVSIALKRYSVALENNPIKDLFLKEYEVAIRELRRRGLPRI